MFHKDISARKCNGKNKPLYHMTLLAQASCRDDLPDLEVKEKNRQGRLVSFIKCKIINTKQSTWPSKTECKYEKAPYLLILATGTP